MIHVFSQQDQSAALLSDQNGLSEHPSEYAFVFLALSCGLPLVVHWETQL